MLVDRNKRNEELTDEVRLIRGIETLCGAFMEHRGIHLPVMVTNRYR